MLRRINAITSVTLSIFLFSLRNGRGKNGFFEFNQIDFGVQFVPFMRDIIQPTDAKWQSHAESLSETNRWVARRKYNHIATDVDVLDTFSFLICRCFFLHFGVAMGLHPFSLQQCFRNAAAELLKFPENEMTIFFGTFFFLLPDRFAVTS